MTRLDLSFSAAELDAYLATQRTARVATVGEDGVPHVVPLWFVWHEHAVFLNSTLGNPTVNNLLRTGKAAAVVDDGEAYNVLRGVVLTAAAERAEDDPRLADVEAKWSEKYMGGARLPFRHWRNRLWIRLVPDRTASWDFRKIPEARARRDAAKA